MATYDDFMKAYQDGGFSSRNFSNEDMTLARINPDAGMQLIQAKTDWNNATTPEARALANANANRIRDTYGGYTAGANGMNYNRIGSVNKSDITGSVLGKPGDFDYTSFNNFAKENGQDVKTWSNADQILAAANPEAGMNLVRAKANWTAAGTDAAAQQKANDYANSIRMNYGGYTAGDNGLQFVGAPGTIAALPEPDYSAMYDQQNGGSAGTGTAPGGQAPSGYDSFMQEMAARGIQPSQNMIALLQTYPEYGDEILAMLGGGQQPAVTSNQQMPQATALPQEVYAPQQGYSAQTGPIMQIHPDSAAAAPIMQIHPDSAAAALPPPIYTPPQYQLSTQAEIDAARQAYAAAEKAQQENTTAQPETKRPAVSGNRNIPSSTPQNNQADNTERQRINMMNDPQIRQALQNGGKVSWEQFSEFARRFPQDLLIRAGIWFS